MDTHRQKQLAAWMPVALSWLWCAKQKPLRTLWSRSCVDRHYWQYNTQNYYYYYYYVTFLRGKAESWRVCVCAHWQVRSLDVLREMHALPNTFFRTAALEMDSHLPWGDGTLRVTHPPMGSVVQRSMEDKHEEKNVHRATCFKESDATRRRRRIIGSIAPVCVFVSQDGLQKVLM